MREAVDQARSVKWGWRILIGACALYVLNGATWFFLGPAATVADMADNFGVSVETFEATYPEAATHLAVNTRWVAVYHVAIGTMGVLAAILGSRQRERWAWLITWVFVATLFAVVVIALPEGVGGFGVAMSTLALIALTGQLLARRGLTGPETVPH
jgi:hypothetical protein